MHNVKISAFTVVLFDCNLLIAMQSVASRSLKLLQPLKYVEHHVHTMVYLQQFTGNCVLAVAMEIFTQ